MGYLTIDEFKARTAMPSIEVDGLGETYVESRLDIGSSEIDSRLRKRYAVPFNPVPEVIRGWLASIVTPECYMRRGWDPSSEEGQAILANATQAREQIKEAADAKDGLYDLPLRDGAAASAITGADAPIVYSEPDAYAWLDQQREAVRDRR